MVSKTKIKAIISLKIYIYTANIVDTNMEDMFPYPKEKQKTLGLNLTLTSYIGLKLDANIIYIGL